MKAPHLFLFLLTALISPLMAGEIRTTPLILNEGGTLEKPAVFDGKGMVIERGKFNPAPPTFHQQRIRQMPDGQLFATISNGVRMMPAYAPQIPTQNRWAIVSYVRALQLSQGE